MYELWNLYLIILTWLLKVLKNVLTLQFPQDNDTFICFVADDPHAFSPVPGSSMKHRLKDSKRNIYQLQHMDILWILTQTHCQGKNYEIM